MRVSVVFVSEQPPQLCIVGVGPSVADVGIHALVGTVDANVLVIASGEGSGTPSAEGVSLRGGHPVTAAANHRKQYAPGLRRGRFLHWCRCGNQFDCAKSLLKNLENLLADLKLCRVQVHFLEGNDVDMVGMQAIAEFAECGESVGE